MNLSVVLQKRPEITFIVAIGLISPSSCWRKVEELKVQHEKIVFPPVTAGKAICLKRQWSEVEPELISHCFTSKYASIL